MITREARLTKDQLRCSECADLFSQAIRSVDPKERKKCEQQYEGHLARVHKMIR